MGEPLGNIYHPKLHGNITHGLSGEYSPNKLIKPVFKSPMRVITVNLSETIIHGIDSLLGDLHSSRSEAVRFYCFQGLHKDFQFKNLLNGDVIPYNDLYPENEYIYTDRYGTIWKIKKVEGS